LFRIEEKAERIIGTAFRSAKAVSIAISADEQSDETETMARMSQQARIVLRYALFQIPGVVLLMLILILIRRWVHLPEWVFWGAIGIWLAKDAMLFPFVWRAYDRDRLMELQSLVGTEGIVEERLAPKGYIRVHGELWQAEVIRADDSIERGEPVRIRGIKGLRLQVEKMHQNI
jgi:membrane protein implicated in regulation of membrane protease activity